MVSWKVWESTNALSWAETNQIPGTTSTVTQTIITHQIKEAHLQSSILIAITAGYTHFTESKAHHIWCRENYKIKTIQRVSQTILVGGYFLAEAANDLANDEPALVTEQSNMGYEKVTTHLTNFYNTDTCQIIYCLIIIPCVMLGQPYSLTSAAYH